MIADQQVRAPQQPRGRRSNEVLESRVKPLGAISAHNLEDVPGGLEVALLHKDAVGLRLLVVVVSPWMRRALSIRRRHRCERDRGA